MSTLRTALHELAERFASDVLAAIRSASIEDLLAEHQAAPRRRGPALTSAPRPRALQAHLRLKGKKEGALARRTTPSGRLPRRSASDIEKTLATVVTALKATKAKGLRSEEIQKSLGLDKRELPRVLKTGITKKLIKSRGQKRATVYFAA